jgi:CDP-paratose 2-epimerase
MQEAIALCGEIAGKPMNTAYLDDNRIGDHIWWISDTRRFQRDYPGWRHQYDVRGILEEIHAGLQTRI